MTVFHRKSEHGAPPAAADALARLGRLAGRLVLWGCVLLLLLRGIASVLAGPPRQPSRTPVTVTVTQPAASVARGSGR